MEPVITACGTCKVSLETSHIFTSEGKTVAGLETAYKVFLLLHQLSNTQREAIGMQLASNPGAEAMHAVSLEPRRGGYACSIYRRTTRNSSACSHYTQHL